ncbi:MAG: tRNA (adenosine(37)-N6)-threonylcarbamoyltransferase complex ATPase subunit type 1 TsaE [Nannocystaceae bacterium]|nr:tRNA (adenosine(37)-N6)-threonylcarbamoyltransferase complex ATPase subunit type 1 TsaE [Nannocystaceae bacterium]
MTEASDSHATARMTWPLQLRAIDESTLATFARALGQQLRHGPGVAEAGALLLLSGPMGAGKTTFTRALSIGLGVTRPDRVCSPTFNLCREHDGPLPLVHVDLCRLGELGGDDEGSAAFEALGLDELFARAAAGACVLAIEWAQLLPVPPVGALSLTLARGAAPHLRALEAAGVTAWERPLAAAWAACTAEPPP